MLRILSAIIVWFLLTGAPGDDGTPPFSLPPEDQVLKLRSALIETDQGDIIVELFPQDAPWHVANFKYLADRKLLRDIPFSHYHPSYIIQTGLPSISLKGLAPYSLPAEFSDRVHELGTLGMARKPNMANYDRSSSALQFHFILGRSQHMDGQYTIFGKVRDGFTTLKRLREGDYIKNVTVMVRE